MRNLIRPGIGLTVLPTTQFKNTRISIQFLAPFTKQTATARALMTSLLETNSARYKTQAALAGHLETMFGADFNIGVSREGALHRVSVTMSVLADRYAGEQLFTAAVDFLEATLLHPNLVDGVFESTTFLREQANLGQYFDSLSDDRQTQAMLGLQRLYFGDQADQASPSFGTGEVLTQLTPQTVTQTYQQMRQQDQIEIIVLGDVDPEAVMHQFAAWPLEARDTDGASLFVDQPVHPDVLEKQERVVANQTKLDLAYHVTMPDGPGPAYDDLVVMEALFGGADMSLLFTEVRERASLAYYASSSFDPLRHMITVQTGINLADRQQVEQLVASQLHNIALGNFTQIRLDAVKRGLISQTQSAYDSPRFLINRALYHVLMPDAQQDFESYRKRIFAVDKKRVQAAAAMVALQAVYVVAGQEAV